MDEGTVWSPERNKRTGQLKDSFSFLTLKIMMNNMYIEKQCQDLRPDTDLPTI